MEKKATALRGMTSDIMHLMYSNMWKQAMTN